MKRYLILFLLSFIITFSLNVYASDSNKSIFNLGGGIGLPYGLVGMNVEVLANSHFGVTAGFDFSPYHLTSYGCRLYLGNKINNFRIRFTGFVGDIGIIYFPGYQNEYKKAKINGKSIYSGFRWKVIKWLSLNFDLGYSVPDNKTIEYSYQVNGSNYLSVVEVKSKSVIALGFATHF